MTTSSERFGRPAISLFATAIIAIGCSSSTGGSAAPSTSQPTPTVEATPTGIPTPTPLRTAAPGQPWGGLVGLDPVTSGLPWSAWPACLTTWQGKVIGIGQEASWGTSVVSSTDWIRWTTVARGSALPFEASGRYDCRALVASDSRLVLAIQPVGQPLQVWTSADSIAWQRVAGSVFVDGVIYQMVAGPTGFLAGGYVGDRMPASTPVVWYSATGLEWHKTVMPGSKGKTDSVNTVGLVPGGFVAGGMVGYSSWWPEAAGGSGGEAVAWYSADGVTWKQASVQVPEGGIQGMNRIYPAVHGLLAVGGSNIGDDASLGVAWTSTDGRSWTGRAISTGSPQELSAVTATTSLKALPVSAWLPIASDGSRLISVIHPGGYDSPVEVWESLDGATWEKLNLSGNGWVALWPADEFRVLPDGVVLFGYPEQPEILRAVAVP